MILGLLDLFNDPFNQIYDLNCFLIPYLKAMIKQVTQIKVFIWHNTVSGVGMSRCSFSYCI